MSLSKQMPGNSRVWVYQADREFSGEEISRLFRRTEDFVESWTSHSKDVKANYELRYNRFLILMLDESYNPAGGCSIDSSFHFIKSLESEFNNSLTERMKFAFKIGNDVAVVSKEEFEKLVGEGSVSDNTIVFNNLVSNKTELDSDWELPFAKSWHKSYFGIKA
jgi:hypothetical protein